MRALLLLLLSLPGSQSADDSKAVAAVGGRRRSSAPERSADMTQVLEILGGIVDDIEKAKEKGKILQKGRKQKCKATLTELQAALEKGRRISEEAEADLKEVDTEAAGITATLEGFKGQIQRGHEELKRLIQRLRDMRENQARTKQDSQTSLQQIEAVIAGDRTTHLRAEHKRDMEIPAMASAPWRASARPPQPDVSFLQLRGGKGRGHASARPLQPDVSFLQLGAAPKGAGRGPLSADRRALIGASGIAGKAFNKMEGKLVELIKDQREEVEKLEESYADQRPVLLDKLRQSAEVNRTLTMATRGVERDSELLMATREKCNFMEPAAEQQNKLKDEVSGPLQMSAKLLGQADTNTFLAEDLHSLKGGPLSFVQAATWRSPSRNAGRNRNGKGGNAATEGDVAGAALGEAVLDALRTAAELQRPSFLATLAPQETPTAANSNTDRTPALVQQGGAATAAGPFDKVSQMIRTLMGSLREQANSEVNKHQWCLEGKNENDRERRSTQEALEALEMQVRWAKTAISRLEEEISFLQDEIKRHDEAARIGDTEVEEENKRVTQEISNLEGHSESVSKILVALHELCDLDDPSPVTVGGNSSSSAPMGLRNPTSKPAGNGWGQCSEAAKLLNAANGKIAECNKASQKYLGEHKKLSQVIVEGASGAEREHVLALTAAEGARAKRANELAVAQDGRKEKLRDLELVDKMKKQLEHQCGPQVETREDRIRRREEEIAALKDALSVLEGETVAV